MATPETIAPKTATIDVTGRTCRSNQFRSVAKATLYILTGVDSENYAVLIATGTEEAMHAKAKTAECKESYYGMMVTPLEVEIS